MYISFLILAQGVQPLILYNYLLSHEQQYSMEVMQLQPEPHDQTAADQPENEYVLVHTSSHKVPYRDHQVKAFFFTPVPRVKIIVIDRNLIRSFKENKNLDQRQPKNVLNHHNLKLRHFTVYNVFCKLHIF